MVQVVQLSEDGSHARVLVGDTAWYVYPIPRHDPTGKDWGVVLDDMDVWPFGEYESYDAAVDAALVAGLNFAASGKVAIGL